MFERTKYLRKVEQYIGKNIIKVFTGQRRVGKSYLLLQLIEHIKASYAAANIIAINKELYEFEFIINDSDLYHYFRSKYIPNKPNFLFIDEIQEITNFERCIRSILASNEADIYITGSNADILSGGLATFLSGRYIEIKVNSLSYSEFLLFHQLENSNESFERYIRIGALPGLIHFNQDNEAVSDYMKGIFSTVLLKDVVKRFNIRNVNFLENLVFFVADNLGSVVSAKRISDFLKSQHIKISPNVVIDYLNYLCKAYLVNKVPRYDIAGRRIFEIGEKYYFEDWGLRNSIIGYKISDINKILENIVYSHLVYSGYKVFVGSFLNKEIDFVAERNGERIYVQVCYLLSDEKVSDREFGNLLEIEDNYPKFVVSMDEINSTSTHKGISNIHIRNFCLLEI